LFSAVLAVLFSDITLNRNAAFAAGLSSGAQSTLSGMQRENLPFLSGLPTDLKSKFDGSGAYFSTPEMSVGKLKAVFTLYRPKPKGKFVFSAILSDISLGALNLDAGPLDQVGMQSVVVVYAPDALGKTNVSRWPGKLGGALKGLTPSARNTNLTINKSLNVFLRLDSQAGGEFAALLKQVGLKLENVTATVRLSKQKKKTVRSAEIMHWGAWKDPFQFQGASFRDVTILLAQDPRRNKTVQAWGDFSLKGKTYFMWGGVTSGPTKKGRAFGLGARNLPMQALMDFTDALPEFSKYRFGAKVADALPFSLNDIKITNPSYKFYRPGVFPRPNTFTVFYAEPGIDVANTRKKGPIFAANGTARILGWNASSYNADVDPREGRLKIRGRVSSPKLDPIPMSDTLYQIDVDAKKPRNASLTFRGKYTLGDMTLAGAEFRVAKSGMKLTVNQGCVPPMLKATINAKFSKKIPAPKIGPSGCAEQIGREIGKAAKAAGHTIKNVAEEVGGAIAGIARSFKKEKKRTTNADIPLFRTAARHKLLTEIYNDMGAKNIRRVNMTSIVLAGYNIPYGMGHVLPKVWVDRNAVLRQIASVNCRADGRISSLLKAQKAFSSAHFGPLQKVGKAMEKQAKAELAFYRPFQANVTKVKGILKANKKPKVKIVNRMPVIEFDRDYQYLSRCENG
tara:strand:+ start:6107 stop:8146 length:2040 start_codon:yes stop_codon:yes gene_type:complete